MKAILHLITVAAAVASSASATPATNNGNNNEDDRDLQGFVCDIPTSGCSNGMFNQAKCECECLSPFCHDMNGDCTNPSNNCGGNVWAQCTRGVNCPWWVNPMKAESCTTGPSVSSCFMRAYWFCYMSYCLLLFFLTHILVCVSYHVLFVFICRCHWVYGRFTTQEQPAAIPTLPIPPHVTFNRAQVIQPNIQPLARIPKKMHLK